MEGWSSEATGVSIDPISGSGCSSCCGIVLFSFSASVAGSSISATVASLALTAVSAAGTGVFLDRVAMWPHSGAQGDTCGNHCHYDEFLHFSSSLDAKRAPDPIAVWQETERSFS